MKLSQAHVHPERETQTPDPQPANPTKNSGAGEEASEIRNPQSAIQNQKSAAWLRRIMLGGVLVIVFLVGVLFARAGGAATPTALPAVHGLAVITSTLPARVTTAAPAATPQPTFGDAPPTLYINVPATNWEQITAARERALKRGILLAEDNPEVQGVLRYNNTDIPIKISLKGDWADHVRGEKWSLHIKTDQNYTVFGLPVFAIMSPPMRNYANEWAYHANLIRDGILAPRYRFVNVVLNGEPKGIYALEEGFSSAMFEPQKRAEGFIMRYDENLLWTQRSLSPERYAPPGVEMFHVIDEYQSNRLDKIAGLSHQREAGVGMLRGVWIGQMRASDVFDVNLMGRFLALTNLWGGQHGLFWHNLRYFYAQWSTRIEPIGYNANALDPASAEIDLASEVFYDDPLLQASYVKAALEVTSPEYLSKLEADLGPQFTAWDQALSDEYGDLPLPWAKLRERARQMRERIQPVQAVYANTPLGTENVLDIGNFMAWPVEVIGLDTGQRVISLERGLVVSDSQQLLVDGVDALALKPLAAGVKDVAYARFRIPSDVISLTVTNSITVVTRLLGGTDRQLQPVVRNYPQPRSEGVRPTATVEEALAQHPFLQVGPRDLYHTTIVSGVLNATSQQMSWFSPGLIERAQTLLAAEKKAATPVGWFWVQRGDWTVKSNLVIPKGYGLHIGPGTTLRFGKGVIVAVYGPLSFEGEADAPILLTHAADTERWGGVGIMEAGVASEVRYTTVEYTAGMAWPGWGTAMTGDFVFFKSPGRVIFSHFQHTKNTNEALKFVISPFEVLDSSFEDIEFDAFDTDFSSGWIEGCTFSNIGGDAIDLSITPAVVRHVVVSDLEDKGVSAGEGAEAYVEDLVATRPYFGIASKDSSRILAHNIKISEPVIAGLAAFTKKPEYGPASLTAYDIEFDNVERPTLVQTGNWIDLDGKRIWGSDVDVEGIYQKFAAQVKARRSGVPSQ